MFELVFTVFLLIGGHGQPQKAPDMAIERKFTSRAACEERARDVDDVASGVLELLGENKFHSTIASITPHCEIFHPTES